MTSSRKFTLDDLWTLKDTGKVALSPDGRRVAFAEGSRDKEKNEFPVAVMLLHLDEQGRAIGEPRRLTSGMKVDFNPVWAPDSRRLLFLSNREGESNQLWLIDTDGGEARKLTNMLNGVSDAAWSPDGKWIAFTAAVGGDDDDEVLVGRKALDEAAKKKREEEQQIALRTITKIWYRVDGRGMFEKFNQLFIMPAPQGDEPVGSASIRRLTTGDYDHNLPIWTPDSLEIGVLCNRAEDRDRSWISDLWLVQRETGEMRQITDGSLQIYGYSWSRDGRQVVLCGSQDMRKEGSSLARLYLASQEGGAPRALLASIDRDIAPATGLYLGFAGPYFPQWSEDGKRIYVLVTDRGRVNAGVVDVERDTLAMLTTGEHIMNFLGVLPGESGLVLTQEEPLHPWELYLLPLNDAAAGEVERLTWRYDRQLAEFALSEPERIEYKGVNDEAIDGWLIRPVGAKEGVRYPLLLCIHGGPQGAYGAAMNPSFQYYAAQGFAVFYCNPHGSTGSGEAFMREVEGDWGGWDYQDIMRGVDECIARGVSDPERLAVTGYSYGGYMSMFIIGQTQRFKAAIPMAGISNLGSFVGTSDIGFWQVLQAKGYPWDEERTAYYRERSPLTYAGRVTTPTLLFHPENDLRCPIEQTEQFYMALKMMGKVPVEFVRVPAAWHMWTRKPSLLFAREEKVMEWCRKYIEFRAEEYQD